MSTNPTHAARNLSISQLTELLNECGTVHGVVTKLAGGRHEPTRRVITQRIKEEHIQWTKFVNKQRRYTPTQVRQAFNSAICWSDIYRHLNVTISDHNKSAILNFAARHNIPAPQFTTENLREAYKRGKRNWSTGDIFKKDSQYPRSILRRAVIKHHIIPKYQCSKCNSLPVWEDETLILELDHINGESTDNQPNNLRWLCPNCHSQTHTYKGRTRS